MNRHVLRLLLICGALLLIFAALPAAAANGGTPQASITLNSCNTALCNKTNTDWSLSKCETDANGNCLPNETVYTDQTGIPTSITWNITATKGATSDKFLTVTGYLSVTNTGTAPATIGNIVINLQKQVQYKKKTYWVSAAADIADATWGDLYNNAAYGAASSTPPLPICANGNGNNRCADIVASSSAEDPTINAAAGPGNYLTYTNTAGWVVGTFKETAGSGEITFTDASNNQIWNITPQFSLAAGATVNLLYQANFDNTTLGLADNASVRVEALVSFGNAGGRGGSGSSAKNIDINGNGTIDTNAGDSNNEGNVRTVPCRTTTNVPATENANASVTLTDPDPHTGSATLDSNLQPTFTPDASGIITFGGVSYSNFSTDVGGGTGTETLSSSVNRSVGVNISVTGLGAIANCALLQGQSDTISLTDPNGNVFTFPCSTGVNLQACAWPYFNPGTQTNFCSATQGGWGAKPAGINFGALLLANFSAVYQSQGGSVTVGTQPNFHMTFDSAAAIQAYLPAGGPAAALNANLLDPHCTSHPCGQVTSSGVFGGQVLTLQLNLDFSAAGVTAKGLDGVTYNNAGCENGQTYGQILADANTALGGGGLPSTCSSASGYTIDDLNNVVTTINQAYDNAPGCPTGGNTALLSIPNPIQYASLDAFLSSRERMLGR